MVKKKKNIFSKILSVFKYIGNEIFIFIKSFLHGIYFIITIPVIIFNFLANIVSSADKKITGVTKKNIANDKKESKPKPISKNAKKLEQKLTILQIDKNGDDAKRTEKKHIYEYIVKDKTGKFVRGYFSALSRLDTYSYLLDEGYEIYQIKTSSFIDFVHGETKYFSTKMSNKDLIFWLTQLSTYIKSGIPLTDAVKILAKQNKKKKYVKVYDSIIYELTMGESFSAALEKQGTVFPGLLINMIKASELIGDIEGTLDEMSLYYNDIEDTRKSLLNALTYPSIIFVFAIIVVTFIMVYIIPQFVDVYETSNIELNPLTSAIINISDFIQRDYIYIILFTIIIVGVYIVLFKSIKAFRAAMQYAFMHIPIVGKLIIYREMNLFSKTFAALNKNNVLLTDSIEILGKITKNEVYKKLMYDTIGNLLKGDPMSISFKDNWAVPELAYYMITTGESTGELSNMLEKVSDYYQKEQKSIANALKSLVEPLMIALLAVIVGVIILSILIPMFGLYSAIQ